MEAVYGDERSNLSVGRTVIPFTLGHLKATLKRIVYNHFLRGFSVASLELLLAVPFLFFGFIYGASTWIGSSTHGVPATSGQVMIAALPIILGMQLLLAFIQFDVEATPTDPLGSLTSHDD